MAARYIVPGLSDDPGDKEYWWLITEVVVAKAPFDAGMVKRILHARQVLNIPIKAEGDEAREALEILFASAA